MSFLERVPNPFKKSNSPLPDRFSSREIKKVLKTGAPQEINQLWLD
ncbi:MAG: hypothetical protein KBC00_03855 [Candidatus Levybacteria bacterium]|nr:hypothetical protein [Candidatus Levybacteria bacterium]MBP9814855.1 hypothetical protein [Candidatus Levybacteria bacterium]